MCEMAIIFRYRCVCVLCMLRDVEMVFLLFAALTLKAKTLCTCSRLKVCMCLIMQVHNTHSCFSLPPSLPPYFLSPSLPPFPPPLSLHSGGLDSRAQEAVLRRSSRHHSHPWQTSGSPSQHSIVQLANHQNISTDR